MGTDEREEEMGREGKEGIGRDVICREELRMGDGGRNVGSEREGDRGKEKDGVDREGDDGGREGEEGEMEIGEGER